MEMQCDHTFKHCRAEKGKGNLTCPFFSSRLKTTNKEGGLGGALG